MPHADALALKTDLLNDVLERMANGEILTAICKEIGYKVNTFSSLAARDAEFGERYARAREAQAHALAMDVVRIADEEPDPARARVRCDARKWVAARIDPKNYGDRMQHDHKLDSDPQAVPYSELQAIAQGRTLGLTIEHDPTAQQIDGTDDTEDD
jgi:hypothetical protein